jgi:hypothetical protein
VYSLYNLYISSNVAFLTKQPTNLSQTDPIKSVAIATKFTLDRLKVLIPVPTVTVDDATGGVLVILATDTSLDTSI